MRLSQLKQATANSHQPRFIIIGSHQHENLKYKRPESVLVVVHTDADALLIKRADHPDFWQSVTGSLEPGEEPYTAALRELAEETGIHVPALRTTGITRSYEILDEWKPRYPAGVTRNHEHLFYCKLDAQCDITIDPREHTDYQWLPFAQACERVYSWSNRLSLMSLR